MRDIARQLLGFLVGFLLGLMIGTTLAAVIGNAETEQHVSGGFVTGAIEVDLDPVLQSQLQDPNDSLIIVTCCGDTGWRSVTDQYTLINSPGSGVRAHWAWDHTTVNYAIALHTHRFTNPDGTPDQISAASPPTYVGTIDGVALPEPGFLAMMLVGTACVAGAWLAGRYE